MKILYRYILLEILKLFTVLLSVFIFVILVDRVAVIANSVLGQGVSIVDFLSVLLKAVPAFLSITIPLALMLSTVIAFAQAGSNNEIIALKSCGVSVYQISKPVILLSVLLSVISLTMVFYVTPKSNISMKKGLEKLIRKKITLSIMPRSFSSNFPGVTFYATNVYPDKGYLKDFMVSVRKKDKLLTIFANEGLLRRSGNNVFLDISNGTAQLLNWRKPKNFKLLSFKTYTLKLYTFSKGENFKDVKYKTLRELISKGTVDAKLEMSKRLTMALSPLIMGIIAFSLGIMLPKGSTSSGVLLSLIFSITYYVVYVFSKKIAANSNIFLLPLADDIIFGLIALFLYVKSIKGQAMQGLGNRW